MVESVRGVVTIGSPVDPQHVTELFTCDIAQVERQGIGEVSIGGRNFTITRQFLEDLRSHPPQKWLGTLRKDVLIFHAPTDNIVSIRNAEQIFGALKHPKSFVSLDSADHLLSRNADALFVAATIGGWSIRHMPPKPPQASALRTDKQVVARIGTQRYATDIVAGRHTMIVDEPAANGGQDLGGDPFAYLLGSLGACTAITLRMYADRKSLPVEEIRIHLSHATVDDRDAGSRSALIEIELEIVGDLTQPQLERMIYIAGRCPVHRTLVGTIQVRDAPTAGQRIGATIRCSGSINRPAYGWGSSTQGRIIIRRICGSRPRGISLSGASLKTGIERCIAE